MVSSRSQLVDVMTKYPQRCIITNYPNSNGQAPALDMGQDLPNYGRIYISDVGMKWLAERFQYVHKSDMGVEVDKLKTELLEAHDKIATLESALNKIPEIIEGMANGLKQLSLDTMRELLSVSESFANGDTGVVAEKGNKDDGGNDEPTIVASRRNGKATSK